MKLTKKEFEKILKDKVVSECGVDVGRCFRRADLPLHGNDRAARS